MVADNRGFTVYLFYAKIVFIFFTPLTRGQELKFFEIHFETPCIPRRNFQLEQSISCREFESLMTLLKNSARPLYR